MSDDIDAEVLRQVQSPDDLTDETRPYFAPGRPVVVNEYVTDAVLGDAPEEAADGG